MTYIGGTALIARTYFFESKNHIDKSPNAL